MMKRITRHCLFPVCFCFFCPVNAILPAVTQEIHQRWCRLYRCSCLESRASGPWTPHELRSWLLTFSESRAFCPSGFCPCPLWSVPFRASPLMGAGSHSRVQSGPRGVVSVCLHPGRAEGLERTPGALVAYWSCPSGSAAGDQACDLV